MILPLLRSRSCGCRLTGHYGSAKARMVSKRSMACCQSPCSPPWRNDIRCKKRAAFSLRRLHLLGPPAGRQCCKNSVEGNHIWPAISGFKCLFQTARVVDAVFNKNLIHCAVRCFFSRFRWCEIDVRLSNPNLMKIQKGAPIHPVFFWAKTTCVSFDVKIVRRPKRRNKNKVLLLTFAKGWVHSGKLT